MTEPRRSLEPWLHSAIVAATSRAVFIWSAYAAAWFFSVAHGPLSAGTLDMWRQFDAKNFISVAAHGYTAGTYANTAAFFPLFPFLMRALHALGIGYVTSGMLINAAACLVAFAFLYRLVSEEISPGAARKAVMYLAFFPTAVFLVAPYSEALFLAGSIAAFYYARRRRWHLVGIPAAVAVATRFAGVFLLIGLVIEFVAQRTWTRRRIATASGAIAAGAAPLIAYFGYLWHIFGTPWAYFDAQRRGWGRAFVGPITSFLSTWHTANSAADETHFVFNQRLEIVAAAAGLAIVIWAIARREWGYAAFCGAMLAALATSSGYVSIPRALLTMFPVAIFLGRATEAKPRLHEPILLAFTAFAVLGTIVFTRGSWFF